MIHTLGASDKTVIKSGCHLCEKDLTNDNTSDIGIVVTSMGGKYALCSVCRKKVE
jgi:hypothetical protein